MNTKQLRQKILDLAIRGKLEDCDTDKWQSVKISDAFIINPRNSLDDELFVSFVSMPLIDSGYTNRFSFEERKWEEVKSGFTHFQDGDVGIAKITPCLENRKSVIFRGLTNGVGSGTTELHIFRIKDEDNITPEYFLWFVKSEAFIKNCVASFTGSVGQKRVGKNAVADMIIPLPPLAEQRRIVAAIESAFAVIDEIERNKAELQAAVTAAKRKILSLAIQGKLVPQDPNDKPIPPSLDFVTVSNSTLPESWAWSRVDKVCEKQETKYPSGVMFRYIDIDSIDNKRHCVTEPKEVETEYAPSRAAKGVRYGDTLFSMVRPYLENIAFVTEDLNDCIASTGFYVCRPRQDIVFPRYLFHFFRSQYAIAGIDSYRRGDNSPAVRKDEIGGFLVPLPPLEEQRRIVSAIEAAFEQLDRILENLNVVKV